MEQLNVLTISPRKDQSFILSTTSERHIIEKYKWRALRLGFVFFIMGSLAIWAINIRLGM